MIRHKRVKRGSGIFDLFKPYKDVIGKVADISQNTRDIIKEIKTPPKEIQDAVNRINKLRMGRGFAYV